MLLSLRVRYQVWKVNRCIEKGETIIAKCLALKLREDVSAEIAAEMSAIIDDVLWKNAKLRDEIAQLKSKLEMCRAAKRTLALWKKVR